MRLGLIDAQWLLRRNKEAMDKGKGVNYKELISSFMSSVAKMCIAHDITNPVFLFDKGPYLKGQYISLKTSRYYPSESERQVIPETATEEEKKQIELANKQLDYRLRVEDEFKHAKNFIIKFISKIGIPVVAIKGYEADDLAYYIANKVGIKHEVIFITMDSDWSYLVGPNTIMYRQKRGNQVEIFDAKKMELNPCGIPLQVFYALKTICLGNHNDIMTIDTGNFKTLCEAYTSGKLKEYLGDKYDDFMTRFNACNCDTFFTDEVKDTIISQLRAEIKPVDKLDIIQFSYNFGLRLNSLLLSTALKKLDLFNDILDEPIISFPRTAL